MDPIDYNLLLAFQSMEKEHGEVGERKKGHTLGLVVWNWDNPERIIVGTLTRVCWMFKAHVPHALAKAMTQQFYCTLCTGVPFYNPKTDATIWQSLFGLSWYKNVLLTWRWGAALCSLLC